MNDVTNDMRTKLREGIDELKRMSDEIRVKIHDASIDAKQTWQQLEPQRNALEARLRAQTDGVRASMRTKFAELSRTLSDMREHIREHFQKATSKHL